MISLEEARQVRHDLEAILVDRRTPVDEIPAWSAMLAIAHRLEAAAERAA